MLVFNQRFFTAEQLGLVANLKQFLTLLYPRLYLTPAENPALGRDTLHKTAA